MEPKQSSSLKLQPLTSDDLAYIRALAAEHSVGLERRCARYSRHAYFRRLSAAACLCALVALGADTAYANPSLYKEINVSGIMDVEYACNTIDTMLNKI